MKKPCKKQRFAGSEVENRGHEHRDAIPIKHKGKRVSGLENRASVLNCARAPSHLSVLEMLSDLSPKLLAALQALADLPPDRRAAAAAEVVATARRFVPPDHTGKP
jgi:hypothetical protein